VTTWSSSDGEKSRRYRDFAVPAAFMADRLAWRRSPGTCPVKAGMRPAVAGVIVASSLPAFLSMIPPML
jgi:hypothetical protein